VGNSPITPDMVAALIQQSKNLTAGLVPQEEAPKPPAPVVDGNSVPLAKDIATKMISLGSHVIFFPRGQKGTKESGWQNAATRDLRIVEQKTAAMPYANVGVVGKPDGNWFFDDDGNVLAEYESAHGKISTYRAHSVSGGTHLHLKQNDASREMGNLNGVDDKGAETWSARVSNRYVVAPGSSAHPDNDPLKPEKFYTVIDNVPVIEAPVSFIEFLKSKAGKNEKKPSAATTPGVKVPHGGIHNYLLTQAGRLRQMNVPAEALESTLIALAEENCEKPLDISKIKTMAHSILNFSPGTPTIELAMDQQSTATVDDEPEIEESRIAKRPVFPRWVMAGTSLDKGLVKPSCEYSSKYPELIFIPAVQLYLNALALHVKLKDTPKVVLNMFVGVIAPYGQYFKSTCCELGHDYFNSMGLATRYNKDVTNAEGRTIITSVGSTEGLGKSMQQINAKKAILYFDELGKFAGKAGIENSSLGEDLLSFYESNVFGNTVKDAKSCFNFDAKQYCFGWQFCTTDRAFPRHWAKLDNISTGLNDRMFFLLAPEQPKEAGMYIEPNLQPGALETRKLIDKAIQQGVYEYESRYYADSKFRGLDARGLAAAERLAVYFAVDLGETVITDECVDRARALADYRREVLVYLDPVEAETLQGKIQQEITRELRRNGGKMPYRKLHHELHGERLGSGLWGSSFQGLLDNGTVAVRAAKPGKGATQRPKMVYLLKQEDYSSWKPD